MRLCLKIRQRLVLYLLVKCLPNMSAGLSSVPSTTVIVVMVTAVLREPRGWKNASDLGGCVHSCPVPSGSSSSLCESGYDGIKSNQRTESEKTSRGKNSRGNEEKVAWQH